MAAIKGVDVALALNSAKVEVYVPVSPESEEIKAYVRQQRKPVSYQIEFLEQAIPSQPKRVSVRIVTRPTA